ncbi:LexA family protein [Brochothrix thermosphacta]|uniref:LexA family protein n=1 Tax=Brochothrix thermosphacta TaxID=2756 RepID=UPI0003E84D80|nr:LexA family transcriptional regulator [Brochothrix thermosphacta]EUJ36662.1 hypothetical protein BTHER_06549 [Brochothrix thermosphacta DSM 20171 = FSL F6-1036]
MNSLGNKDIMAKNIVTNMEKHGITRRKLSSDLNISYTTVTDWINAKTYPRIDKIELMANYFNINKSDLVEESTEDNIHPFPTASTELIDLPLYGDVAAGALAEMESVDVWDVENIQLPKVILPTLSSYTNLFAMRVNGDSMDKVIPDHSLVVVKPIEHTAYKDGDIVVFSYNGEYSLKRYRPNAMQKFIIFEADSHNPDFQDIPINKEDMPEANIYGKVVVSINKFD